MFNIPKGEYMLQISDDFIKIEDGVYTFYIKIEKDLVYPKYKSILPTDPVANFSVNKKEILEAIDSALLVANPDTLTVKIVDGHIVAEDSVMGTSFKKKLKIASSGGDLHDIKFNGSYMKTAIESYAHSEVKFSLNGPSRAILVNDNSLVMPQM
jgi:DNA polymerase III sliding clamp (beta) subunit (PCNA family)